MVSSRRLSLSYTIQQVIPNICTRFQNPRCSCSWEIFDTNFPIYYTGVRDGKRRQTLISASCFSFTQYTWPLSGCIQNLKTLALIGAEKSVTEIFIGEKEKWTTKGNDKQEEAESLLSSWENIDEKKSLHTPTNIVTEKTKTLYPLYKNLKTLSLIEAEKSVTEN